MTPEFLQLIDLYVREPVAVRPNHSPTPEVTWALKVATVAQWILESGRGESDLAEQHNNFGGLKWIDPSDTRTDPYATRVHMVTPSEPQGEYWRKFASLNNWLLGYWTFIDTGSYEDPLLNANDPEGYIQMLKDHGYATDQSYVTKVIRQFDEAEALLYDSAQRQGIDPDDAPDPPKEGSFKLAVVVGHNSVAKGACSKYLGEGNCEWPWNSKVADYMAKRASNHGIILRVFFRTSGGSASTEIRRCYETQVNPWNPDLCMELHYNAGGGDGAEMLYWPGSVVGETLAQNLLDEVGRRTGINTDRGIKPTGSGNGSVSLQAARAPNCVVEPFFGDVQNNVDTILAAGGQSALADAYLIAARKTAEIHGMDSVQSVERLLHATHALSPEMGSGLDSASYGDAASAVASDDLTKIKGIGRVLKEKLHGLGITSFQQIADFTRGDIDRVNEVLNLPGRIEREQWIEQAKAILESRHGYGNANGGERG